MAGGAAEVRVCLAMMILWQRQKSVAGRGGRATAGSTASPSAHQPPSSHSAT